MSVKEKVIGIVMNRPPKPDPQDVPIGIQQLIASGVPFMVTPNPNVMYEGVEGVGEVPAPMDVETEMQVPLLQAGVLTVDEARAGCGLPPVISAVEEMKPLLNLEDAQALAKEFLSTERLIPDEECLPQFFEDDRPVLWTTTDPDPVVTTVQPEFWALSPDQFSALDAVTLGCSVQVVNKLAALESEIKAIKMRLEGDKA